MIATSPRPDPLEDVPAPEIVRSLIAEANRRQTLLRSLLRVAVRKANYPRPVLADSHPPAKGKAGAE